MELTFFVSIAMFLLLAIFLIKPKHLHLFEIIFIWLSGIFVYEVFISIAVMNYKVIELSMAYKKYWAFVINQAIVVPLLIVWGVNWFRSSNSSLIKIMYMILFTMFLTGIEFFSIKFGMNKYIDWNLLGSALVFFLIMLFVALINAWFMRILKSEVKV